MLSHFMVMHKSRILSVRCGEFHDSRHVVRILAFPLACDNPEKPREPSEPYSPLNFMQDSVVIAPLELCELREFLIRYFVLAEVSKLAKDLTSLLGC
jgi:hypothetical protein